MSTFYERTWDGFISTREQRRETEIWRSSLSVRTRNCLINDALKTFNEVPQKTDAELLRIHGLGLKCLKEIRDFLSSQ